MQKVALKLLWMCCILYYNVDLLPQVLISNFLWREFLWNFLLHIVFLQKTTSVEGMELL